MEAYTVPSVFQHIVLKNAGLPSTLCPVIRLQMFVALVAGGAPAGAPFPFMGAFFMPKLFMTYVQQIEK